MRHVECGTDRMSCVHTALRAQVTRVRQPVSSSFRLCLDRSVCCFCFVFAGLVLVLLLCVTCRARVCILYELIVVPGLTLSTGRILTETCRGPQRLRVIVGRVPTDGRGPCCLVRKQEPRCPAVGRRTKKFFSFISGGSAHRTPNTRTTVTSPGIDGRRR